MESPGTSTKGLARVQPVMAHMDGISLRHILSWLPRAGPAVRRHPASPACFLAIILASMALILARAGSWPGCVDGASGPHLLTSRGLVACIRQVLQGPVLGTRGEGRATELTAPSGAIETLGDALAVSDDFNVCSLDTGVWTFTDVIGDASWDLMGTHTNDAWLSMSVPGGVDHNIWVEGNRAPRVLQEVSDTDFEVEVKFESGLSQKYQMQGVLVEEDSERFLRLEFHSNGVETRLYAVAFQPDPSPPPALAYAIKHLPTKIADNGVAPLYMRVRRQGDQWTLGYSVDGVDWTSAVTFTHVMTVTKVGTYASNADPDGGAEGEPPAYTGYVDYFFNTASPVYPEDGARAILTVTVDGGGTVSVVPDKTEYDCGEVVTLTAEPDEWFEGWSGDLTGTQNPATITMDTAKTVTASFSIRPRLYLPLAMTPAFSNYLFVGDFETGDLTGFFWNQNKPQVVAAPHPIRAGRYSMRCYLHRYQSQYSYRTMGIVGHPGAPEGTQETLDFVIGESYWIGFSVYIPSGFVVDVEGLTDIIYQNKARPDSGEDYRSPVVDISINADDWSMVKRWDVRRRTPPGNTFSGSEILYQEALGESIGEWTDWVIHVKWSWGSDGFIKVWRDGVAVVDDVGPNCSNDEVGPYTSLGLYKWPWKTEFDYPSNTDQRLFYIDELRIAGANGDYYAVAP